MKPYAITLPAESKGVRLIPAGCLHWPIGEKDLLREWVEAVRSDPFAYTVLMGDSLDAARTHYRKHLRAYGEDENSQEALDELMRGQVSDLAKVLEPIKDRILGVILGNHWWGFLDGTNSEQYLCQILGLRYLGPFGLLRLDFCDGRAARAQLTLVAHHTGGTGGGRTTGGDVNAMVRAENVVDADIYLFGHTHRRHAHVEKSLALTSKGTPRLRERSRVFVRTGAFLKGYKGDEPRVDRQHRPGYAESAMYRPTDLGWVTLRIDLRQQTVGDKDTGAARVVIPRFSCVV